MEFARLHFAQAASTTRVNQCEGTGGRLQVTRRLHGTARISASIKVPNPRRSAARAVSVSVGNGGVSEILVTMKSDASGEVVVLANQETGKQQT